MNRKDAVSLLKDILAACESFSRAEAVSIVKNKDAESYMLRAKWIPPEFEKHCLKEFKRRYDVELSEEDGYTVFSTPKKHP